MKWEYDINILAWRNKTTGEVSENNPQHSTARLTQQEIEQAEDYAAQLPYTSAALAYRRLYGTDYEKIRASFSVLNPSLNSDERIESAILYLQKEAQ